MNLTPREPEGTSSSTVKRGAWLNRIVVAGLVSVLGFLVFQALTNAKVFFYNVDEAIEQRDDLADRTFRMQGTVVSEPVTTDTGALTFAVSFDRSTASVRHIGQEPTDLFQLGQPVVVEGHWVGDTFESTQILVKHDESYVEENPEHVEYDLPAAESS